MIYGLTSIKVVLAKCVRDFNLQGMDIPHANMMEWIAEGLLFIGSYPQFEKKEVEIKIEDFRGSLPCDFYKPIRLLTGNYYDTYNEGLIGYVDELCGGKHSFSNFGYSINFDQITVAYRCGEIALQYLAIPLDDCGLPMIPDSVEFITALSWKVGYHLARLKRDDRESDYCEQRWLKYCGQARASANMPDGDQMERLKNSYLTLYQDPTKYSRLFNDLGTATYR